MFLMLQFYSLINKTSCDLKNLAQKLHTLTSRGLSSSRSWKISGKKYRDDFGALRDAYLRRNIIDVNENHKTLKSLS